MQIFSDIKQLINREIKEENEPKDTAVFIRVFCLTDIFFLTIFAIYSFIANGLEAGLCVIGLTSLIWVTLVLSYYISMNRLVYTYFLTMGFNVVVLVCMFGLSFMFQSQLYILFLIFFYRAAGRSRERIGSVLACTVVLLILISYVGKNGHVIEVQAYGNSFITWACTLYIIAKGAIIGYFFRKKFSASEEKIIRYSQRLEMLATTDPLTKLQNRRGMLNHIEKYVANMRNDNRSLLTICIGDIDLFKHINDTYGHDAGDYVLETIAKIMNEFMDGKGMVARWGGEEFLFSLEGINGDYGFEEISKLLHLIERYEFSFEGTPINVTMTFGVEEYDDNAGIDRVISKADEKLYMGKEQGRNRVIY